MFKQAGLHYPLVLQRLLQKKYPGREIQVLNLGKSAYSTAHSLILLELNALDWNPDLIIISHNINDLTAAYFPGFKPDYANKYGSKYYTLSARLLEEYNTLNLLVQHFQLYWILKGRIQARLDQDRTERAEFKRRSYGMKPPPAAAGAYSRNLESMVLLARSRGVDVIVGTQPLEPSEEYFRRHMGHKPLQRPGSLPPAKGVRLPPQGLQPHSGKGGKGHRRVFGGQRQSIRGRPQVFRGPGALHQGRGGAPGRGLLRLHRGKGVDSGRQNDPGASWGPCRSGPWAGGHLLHGSPEFFGFVPGKPAQGALRQFA